jgi:flagellar basal-body rod modification protein FlgD
MDGTPVTLSPTPKAGADRAILVVKDQGGNTVTREDIPAQDTTYIWEGKDILGASLPNGAYSLSLESYSEGIQIAFEPVESYARIQEVQTGTTGPRLILAGGVSISAEDITALRNAN